MTYLKTKLSILSRNVNELVCEMLDSYLLFCTVLLAAFDSILDDVLARHLTTKHWLRYSGVGFPFTKCDKGHNST